MGNMEVTEGCGDTEHCPNQYCRPGEKPKFLETLQVSETSDGQIETAAYNTLVWVYEWPRETSSMKAFGEPSVRLVARLGSLSLLGVDEELTLQKRLLAKEPEAEKLISAYAAEFVEGQEARVAA